MITGDMDVYYCLRYPMLPSQLDGPSLTSANEKACLQEISKFFGMLRVGRDWWPSEAFDFCGNRFLQNYRECKPVYSKEILVAYLLRHYLH